MPLYEAQCNKCSSVHQYIKPVSQCRDTPLCCGEQTKKVILSAPASFADIPDYISPVTGKLISGKRQREEDLKRSGCRPWEGMEVERREAQKRKAATEAEWDKQNAEAVGKAWQQISQESRDILTQAQ